MTPHPERARSETKQAFGEEHPLSLNDDGINHFSDGEEARLTAIECGPKDLQSGDDRTLATRGVEVDCLHGGVTGERAQVAMMPT